MAVGFPEQEQSMQVLSNQHSTKLWVQTEIQIPTKEKTKYSH